MKEEIKSELTPVQIPQFQETEGVIRKKAESVEKEPKLSNVFYAMPFIGKGYEELVETRTTLREKMKSYSLDLTEQFVGVEEKEKYEAHEYGPLFIAKKDHDLIKSSGLVIADYEGHSIGRDCEIVIAKEVFDKRVIAVVPDPHMQNHPWIRLYSDYIVSTQEEAFELSKKLSVFNLSSELSKLSREQKDTTDVQLAELLKKEGLPAMEELLPTELKRRWKILFGDEYEKVLETSYNPLPKTLRVNTMKIDQKQFEEIAKKYSWNIKPLKFSPRAFRLPVKTRPRFGALPEYREGMFYVQELASMLPAVALEPKPGEKILDIAAAPGSKTTQMSEIMEDTGEILANDNSEERLEVLQKAVERHKLTNIKYHLGDGAVLGDMYPEAFDKVMVDAPCSSEGIIRYKAHKFFEWYLLSVYRLTEIQKELIESGYKALKPGGTLVYSTCTFGPEENEAIVDHLIKKYPDAEVVPLEFEGVKTRKGLTKWEHRDFDKSVEGTVRLYPQDNDSIGFFIAKVKKKK